MADKSEAVSTGPIAIDCSAQLRDFTNASGRRFDAFALKLRAILLSADTIKGHQEVTLGF